MAVVKTNEQFTSLLARLMGAEGDDELGRLMVGNIGVNRVRADCLGSRDIF